MKKIIYNLFRIAGLLLTILPSILVFMGNISMDAHKQLMFVGVLLWFGAVFLKD